MQMQRLVCMFAGVGLLLLLGLLLHEPSATAQGLLLASETTEPGVHILATRTETSLTVRRGDRRHVTRP